MLQYGVEKTLWNCGSISLKKSRRKVLEKSVSSCYVSRRFTILVVRIYNITNDHSKLNGEISSNFRTFRRFHKYCCHEACGHGIHAAVMCSRMLPSTHVTKFPLNSKFPTVNSVTNEQKVCRNREFMRAFGALPTNTGFRL